STSAAGCRRSSWRAGTSTPRAAGSPAMAPRTRGPAEARARPARRWSAEMLITARVRRLLGVTGRASVVLMVIGSSLLFAWSSATKAPLALYDFKDSLYNNSTAILHG